MLLVLGGALSLQGLGLPLSGRSPSSSRDIRDRLLLEADESLAEAERGKADPVKIPMKKGQELDSCFAYPKQYGTLASRPAAGKKAAAAGSRGD